MGIPVVGKKPAVFIASMSELELVGCPALNSFLSSVKR
jgi:hypothetical protein